MAIADMEYYLDRARAELALAQRATSPEESTVHCTLAQRLLERVHLEQERVWLSFG